MTPHENIWRPASGYMTANRKPKWRCWNDSLPAGRKEHLTPTGRIWICDTYERAVSKCAELNVRAA